MTQPLTNAQVELLNLFSANLSEADMAKLKAVLADFTSQIASPAQVAEPAASYTRSSANDEQITLSIPKAWLDDVWFAKLMNWLELKRLTERNQMTEADALEMGKQAKADWWAKNQKWVLEKTGEP
jgi:DNA-binding transcriptional regulator YbjK